MKNIFEKDIIDYIDLIPVKVEDSTRFFSETKDADSETGHKLNAVFDLTHSGLITRNMGLYHPKWMKAGMDTWTKPYNAPYLNCHDDSGEALGRVRKVKYIDNSRNYRSAEGVSDFMSSDIKKVLASVDSMYRLQAKDKDYRGLGWLRGNIEVLDPDAIKQILDGRIVTGSSRFGFAHAYCSTCGIDKTVKYCEHTPGKVYSENDLDEEANHNVGFCSYVPWGEPGYDFKEYSVAHIPAIKYSQIVNDSADSDCTFDNEHSTKLINDRGSQPFLYICDSDNGIKMATDNIKITDVPIIIDEFKNSDYDKRQMDLEKPEVPLPNEINNKDTGYDEDIEERHYQEFVSLIDNKDKVLTATQRKKLSAKTFCGPGRSFPVPDHAHAKVAIEVLSQYEGQGDKDAIRSCILKKAKQLGCPIGNNDSDSEGEFLMSELTRAMSNSVTNYSALAEHLDKEDVIGGDELNALAESKFVGANRTFPAHDLAHVEACRKMLKTIKEDAEDKSVISYLKDSLDKRERALKDEADSESAGLSTKRATEIKLLKEQVRDAEAELKDAEDANLKVVAELKDRNISEVIFLTKATGETVDEDKVKEDLKDKENKQLCDTITELRDKAFKKADINPVEDPTGEGTAETTDKVVRKPAIDDDLRDAMNHGRGEDLLKMFKKRHTVPENYTLPDTN